MKSKDTIKIVNDTVFFHFLSTGETKHISIINLKNNAKFYQNENEIISYSESATSSIEKFASESLAKSAFDSLQEQLTNHYRNQSVFNKIKAGLKWVGLPLAILFFGLALNGIVAGSLQNKATPTNASDILTNQALSSLSSPAALPPTPQPSTAAAPAASVPAAELAKGLADGVAAGKFSIQLTSGKKGTLYVFSDPLCPHCKDIEPELEKLKDYTVHILPVTIIGQTGSASLVSQVLCLPPEKRVDAWKKAISGQDIGTSSCEAGDKAFGANDQIFRQMGFPGTPQMVSENGQLPDANVDFTAEGLSNWLNKVL